MHFKPATIAAIAALASQVVAEATYKMALHPHQIFGIVKRQETGYAPNETFCGMGTSCAEACGAGYIVCASGDSSIHCFNPDAQKCCTDASGKACDTGYFCATANDGQTLCCKDGEALDACAKAYGVANVSSQVPKASTSSTTTSSSTSSITVSNTTVTSSESSSTTSCTSTLTPSSGFGGSNTTTTSSGPSKGGPAQTSPPAQVPANAAHATGPASAILALAVAAFALVL
jgi:hypothetical protein